MKKKIDDERKAKEAEARLKKEAEKKVLFVIKFYCNTTGNVNFVCCRYKRMKLGEMQPEEL